MERITLEELIRPELETLTAASPLYKRKTADMTRLVADVEGKGCFGMIETLGRCASCLSMGVNPPMCERINDTITIDE